MTQPKCKRTYRIVREWDIRKADYTYACYMTTHWGDKQDTEQRMATGDRDWAEKNATHFGIEIEDEKR